MPESPDVRAPRAAGGTTVADEPRPPAPPPPAAKRARPKRTRPANPDDQRYPRPAWFQVVRWVFRLWYLSVVAYPVTVVQNLQKLVGSGGQVTPDSLARASLLKALVDLWTRSPWIFGVAVAAVLALTLAGRLAHADQEYEKAVLAERERRARQAEDREGLVAAAPEIVGPLVPPLVEGALKDLGVTPGADAAPEPQGPPFDDGLLPAPDHFVGRSDDLAWVLDRLRPGSATAITALGGMGGIGKTALAAEAVRALKAEGRFPDGIAVVLCEGRADALGILRDVLTRFDPRRRQPEAGDAAGLAETAHALLDGKQALVVLDNVEPGWPVEQVVGPLRAAGAAVLITARQQLAPAAVPADGSRSLDVLPEADALDLFAQALGRADAAALAPDERAAAVRIVRALGRHTLAVKLAGASATATRRDLGALAAELENPQQALRLPEGDFPAAVQHAFATSYKALPADAKRLFAGLASFATPEFGRAAALALGAGLTLADPAASLDTLVTRALLDGQVNDSMPADSDRERLRLHPLLRAFAGVELAKWTDAERDGAQRAIARHYGDYANATPDLALAPDEANVAGALEWAHAEGPLDRDEIVARICDGMRGFWRDTGRTSAGLRYLPWGGAAAEQVAERTGDREDTLRAANIAAYLGDILRNAGQLDAAEQAYQRDLGRRQQIGDRQGEGVALSRLGQVAAARGRLEAAEAYYQQALVVFREVGDRQGEGAVLANLGQVAARRGRLDAAEAYYQQALAIHREVGDRREEGVVLAHLGQVAARRGRLDEAEAYYQQALAIRREVGDRQGEGADLGSLGQVAAARGRLDEAEAYYQQALAVFREVGDRQGEGVVLFSLALIAEARGNLDRAEALHRESLAIGVEVQSGPDIADSLRELGRFLIEHGRNRDEGCRMLGEAEGLYHEMGLPGEDEARATARRLGCA